MKPLTILFGLDGATYTVLDNLMALGAMPNLSNFVSEGVRAKLLSTTPPLTPPAWTTLATGKPPGEHGVLGFFQYATPDLENMQLVSSRTVRVDRLWQMLNRQGKRAGVLNFVAHQPAPVVDGWIIPGWVSWRWLRRFSHPPGLIDKLKTEIPGFDVKTLAMDFGEEGKAVAGSTIDDYRSWVDLHIARERHWFDVLWHQMERDPVDLAAIVFDGVDKLQHGLWPYLDPGLAPADPSPEFQRTRDAAIDYFRKIDGLLGETVRRAGDDATIFICSDHGFTASTDVLYINTWLEQQGYLTWGADAGPVEESHDLNPSSNRHRSFDHSLTKAYAIVTSSNGVHVPVQRTPGGPGLRPEEYEPFVRELTDKLLHQCPDLETGEPLVTRVWRREEIFAGPAMEVAPDLTLTLRDHGFFSVRRGTKTHVRRTVVMGTHHPEGILIARGPGIRHGESIPNVSLIDIAPTALYSLDLEIPHDLPGRFLSELYREDYLAAHELRRSTSGADGASGGATGQDAPDAGDEEIMEKLKALGYLE